MKIKGKHGLHLPERDLRSQSHQPTLTVSSTVRNWFALVSPSLSVRQVAMAAPAEGDPSYNSKGSCSCSCLAACTGLPADGLCSHSLHVLGCWGKGGNCVVGEYDL